MIDWTNPIKLMKKSSFLMSVQEITGIAFDIEKAKQLREYIKEEMHKIAEEIEPQLPARELNKTEAKDYTMPMKPFKQDGTFSSHMVKFMEKHSCAVVDETHIEFEGIKDEVKSQAVLNKKLPISLNDESTSLKEWFKNQGWEPTFWNTKKDEKGYKIKTSPKIADKGRLCPNLEALQGDLVKPIVRYLSLSNRLGVLTGKSSDKGWLNHPRLAHDGRLPSGSSGITPTFRQKHTVVCNIPKNKPDVLLGKEFRSLYIASPGMVLVGWDAAALEDRVKAHWTYKHDGGSYARKILDPKFDVHQENADTWNMTRQEAKSGTYALAYNCGVKTLANTLKCTVDQAEQYHKAYWKINKPVKDLETGLKLYWESEGAKKYILGLDKRKVFVRKESALVNTLVQSTASILMDFAAAWIDKQLGGIVLDKNNIPRYNYKGHVARRVAFMHDEYVFECEPEIAEEIGKLGEESIRAAGRFFKLKVPLESTAAIGNNWAEVH